MQRNRNPRLGICQGFSMPSSFSQAFMVAAAFLSGSCDMNQSDASQGPDEPTSKLSNSAPVPDGALAAAGKVRLVDGSCWDLTKLKSPWRVHGTTLDGFGLVAKATALGLPPAGSDFVEQQQVELGVSTRTLPSEEYWPYGSPERHGEMVLHGLARRALAEDIAGYIATTVLPDASIVYLWSSDRDEVCYGPGSHIELPNAYLTCVRRRGGVRITLRLPFRARNELGRLSTQSDALLQSLRCEPEIG
jgi:hypothetical protein